MASSLADDLHLEGAIVSQEGSSQVQYIQSAETYKEIAEFNKMNNTNYKLSDILDVNSEASRKYLDYKHREDLAKKQEV